MDTTNAILPKEMVLRSEVLRAINTAKNRVAIAAALNVGDRAVANYIERNDTKLTQYSALEVIKRIMGVLEVGELLEPRKEDA